MIKKLVTDFISTQTQNLRDKVAEKCFKLAIENVPEFRQLVGDVAELRQFAIAQTKNTVVVSHALNTQQQNCVDLANALGHIASNQRENAIDMSFPPLSGSPIFGANLFAMLAKYWQTFLAFGALLLAILALAYARLSIKSSAEDFEKQLQIALDSYRIEKESIVIAYEREKRANAEAKAKYDSDLASIKEKYEADIARLDEETKKRFDDIVKSSKGDPKKLAELMKKEFGFEVAQ